MRINIEALDPYRYFNQVDYFGPVICRENIEEKARKYGLLHWDEMKEELMEELHDYYEPQVILFKGETPAVRVEIGKGRDKDLVYLEYDEVYFYQALANRIEKFKYMLADFMVYQHLINLGYKAILSDTQLDRSGIDVVALDMLGEVKYVAVFRGTSGAKDMYKIKNKNVPNILIFDSWVELEDITEEVVKEWAEKHLGYIF